MFKRFKSFLSKKMGVAMMAMTAIMAVMAVGASASTDQSIDFSGSTGFSFTLQDILNTAWSFIAQFNSYLILICALILVPTLIGIVIWLMSKAPKFRRSA